MCWPGWGSGGAGWGVRAVPLTAPPVSPAGPHPRSRRLYLRERRQPSRNVYLRDSTSLPDRHLCLPSSFAVAEIAVPLLASRGSAGSLPLQPGTGQTRDPKQECRTLHSINTSTKAPGTETASPSLALSKLCRCSQAGSRSAAACREIVLKSSTWVWVSPFLPRALVRKLSDLVLSL